MGLGPSDGTHYRARQARRICLGTIPSQGGGGGTEAMPTEKQNETQNPGKINARFSNYRLPDLSRNPRFLAEKKSEILVNSS